MREELSEIYSIWPDTVTDLCLFSKFGLTAFELTDIESTKMSVRFEIGF
jgi:hypothetical protein